MYKILLYTLLLVVLLFFHNRFTFRPQPCNVYYNRGSGIAIVVSEFENSKCSVTIDDGNARCYNLKANKQNLIKIDENNANFKFINTNIVRQFGVDGNYYYVILSKPLEPDEKLKLSPASRKKFEYKMYDNSLLIVKNKENNNLNFYVIKVIVENNNRSPVRINPEDRVLAEIDNKNHTIITLYVIVLIILGAGVVYNVWNETYDNLNFLSGLLIVDDKNHKMLLLTIYAIILLVCVTFWMFRKQQNAKISFLNLMILLNYLFLLINFGIKHNIKLIVGAFFTYIVIYSYLFYRYKTFVLPINYGLNKEKMDKFEIKRIGLSELLFLLDSKQQILYVGIVSIETIITAVALHFCKRFTGLLKFIFWFLITIYMYQKSKRIINGEKRGKDVQKNDEGIRDGFDDQTWEEDDKTKLLVEENNENDELSKKVEKMKLKRYNMYLLLKSVKHLILGLLKLMNMRNNPILLLFTSWCIGDVAMKRVKNYFRG